MAAPQDRRAGFSPARPAIAVHRRRGDWPRAPLKRIPLLQPIRAAEPSRLHATLSSPHASSVPRRFLHRSSFWQLPVRSGLAPVATGSPVARSAPARSPNGNLSLLPLLPERGRALSLVPGPQSDPASLASQPTSHSHIGWQPAEAALQARCSAVQRGQIRVALHLRRADAFFEFLHSLPISLNLLRGLRQDLVIPDRAPSPTAPQDPSSAPQGRSKPRSFRLPPGECALQAAPPSLHEARLFAGLRRNPLMVESRLLQLFFEILRALLQRGQTRLALALHLADSSFKLRHRLSMSRACSLACAVVFSWWRVACRNCSSRSSARCCSAFRFVVALAFHLADAPFKLRHRLAVSLCLLAGLRRNLLMVESRLLQLFFEIPRMLL